MKCLLLIGNPSARHVWKGELQSSFTLQLLDEVKRAMLARASFEFEEIWLSQVGLPYCVGCYNCFFQGEGHCPHADQMEPIMRAIREADCVILTSPVYSLHVSALVKGFFDHAAYNYHRPSFFDKKGLVISSTAGGMARRCCAYMRDTLMHWGFNAVYSLPVVRMAADRPTPGMVRACRRAGERLAQDTLSGKLRAPSPKRLFFYQLWRGLSQNEPTARDGVYWRESGLLTRTFGPGVPVGPLGRAFSAVMYRMLSGMGKRKG